MKEKGYWRVSRLHETMKKILLFTYRRLEEIKMAQTNGEEDVKCEEDE